MAMMAQKVVVCMCGLPASGKTTTAAALSRSLSLLGFNVCVVAFDDALDARLVETDGFSSDVWKSARRESFAQVEAALSGWCGCGEEGRHVCSKPNVVVVDDNMHLSSMRREVYVLAREAEAGLLFVYLQTTAEIAHCRNEERSHGRVDPMAIDRMAASLEPPGSKPFEKNCCVIASDSLQSDGPGVLLSDKALQEIVQRVQSAAPLQSVEAHLLRDSEAKQADTHESLQHTLDLTLRKWISLVMQQCSTDATVGSQQQQRRRVAEALAQAKRQALTALRTATGHELSATAGYGVFVEQAMDILIQTVDAEVADAVGQMLRCQLA